MFFQDLMNCYNISENENNQIVYNQLLSLMKKRNVTPVIGAGLSCWVYPLWKEMFKKQAENYGFENEINEMLDNNQYEKAASFLECELTHNRFISLIQQIFKPSLIKEKIEEYPKYLEMIPQLFRGPIITTNFDRVIEFIFEKKGEITPDIVIPSDSFQNEKIKLALRENNSILLKMHGDIGNPENLILTEESYNLTYGSNPNCPNLDYQMPKILQELLERNPVLFLGCSLDKDRTCAVIKACSSNCPQFAFLELPNETENKENPFIPNLKGSDKKIIKELWKRQTKVWGELNIQAIWYPYGKHKEAFNLFFEQLLEDLKNECYAIPITQKYRIVNKLPQMRDIFCGREDYLEQIYDAFKAGIRTVFLEGIG